MIRPRSFRLDGVLTLLGVTNSVQVEEKEQGLPKPKDAIHSLTYVYCYV